MFFEERCSNCGVCDKSCMQNAIDSKGDYPVVDEDKCSLCGKCTDFCPNNAREYVGKDMSVQELMKEIIKDEIFYDESGGGVTFSGGEPLIQSDFLNEVLKKCKTRGIHTAIDTSGFVSWDKFEKIADNVDLFLFDIKLMDNESHIKYTGVENLLIIENLKKLSDRGCNIYVRMPIISEVNDNDGHIDNAIELLSKLNILQVNLLPYHKMGMDKYRRLNMEYKLTGMEKPSDEKIDEIVNKFKKSNIKVKIGG
jgi:pyruvate formate lyase activating enzyme